MNNQIFLSTTGMQHLIRINPFYQKNVFQEQVSCHPGVLQLKNVYLQLVRDTDILQQHLTGIL